MCEFCVKHGEGKKWYLQAKNYSSDLLSDLKRRNLVVKTAYWTNDLWNVKVKMIRRLPLHAPIVGSLVKGLIQRVMKKNHWGQVIPIEDVERVLSFTNSITRIPCICRIITMGIKEKRLCFLLSLDPGKVSMADIVDQSFLGGPDVAKFEKVDKQWALNFMRECESKGMVHSIWTFGTPFIGAICNCEYSTGCIPMKMYKEITPIMFRAEYVATIDTDKCIGCKDCVKICQFDAIVFDSQKKKASIDTKRCYGCGICRSVCKKDALHLVDRAENYIVG